MVYLDHDYKIDCENKIKYDTLQLVTASSFNTYFKNTNINTTTDVIYESDSEFDDTKVFLVVTNHKLGLSYLKEDCIVKEIANNIYKIVVKIS